MQSPRISPKQVVYQDNYQQIYKVGADFGSFKKEYFVRDSGQRAGLVVVREQEVLLVRQYRYLIDDMSWEIPGGKVEEGEQPQAAAIRECQEETGILCHNLQPLIFYHLGLDINHNPTHLFHTKQFEVTGGENQQPDEIDHHLWVPLSKCIEMIFAQEIVDSFTIVALLSYHTLMLKNGSGPQSR
jgi:ADP-ribose pyrophosphatase